MIYNENFLASIPSSPMTSILEAIDIAEKYFQNENSGYWTQEEYDALFECFSLILTILEEFKIKHSIILPELSGDQQNDCQLIYKFTQATREELGGKASDHKLGLYMEKFKVAIGNSFVYKFSNGDIKRIQELINELRTEVKNCSLIEENHKFRLLKRLEKLQSEIHKYVSDLDRFWGLVGDAGVVLGKLGTDAKPIVDRIKEIAEIAWKVQSRAEELPSNTCNPLIEKHE